VSAGDFVVGKFHQLVLVLVEHLRLADYLLQGSNDSRRHGPIFPSGGGIHNSRTSK